MQNLKLQQRDFYIGAVLSCFFVNNLDSKPSLIENIDNSSQLWRMTTNNSRDFFAYIKYTTDKLPDPKKSTNIRWQFSLTDKDKQCIEKKATLENLPVVLFFLCGMKDLIDSEICVVRYEEYLQVQDKSTITIKKVYEKPNSHPRNFFLHIGKKQSEVLPIKRNRIEQNIETLL